MDNDNKNANPKPPEKAWPPKRAGQPKRHTVQISNAGNSVIVPLVMMLGMTIPGIIILSLAGAALFFIVAGAAAVATGMMSMSTPATMLGAGALLAVGEKTGLNKRLGITPVEKPAGGWKFPSLKSIFGRSSEVPSHAPKAGEKLRHTLSP